MSKGCLVPPGEVVAFPENAYDENYRKKLEKNVRDGECAFGRNFQGTWKNPSFRVGDYVGVHNTVITPDIRPGFVYATLIIPREHRNGAHHLDGNAFLYRGRMLRKMQHTMGPATVWGERFGDGLAGKTIGHEHAQVWRLRMDEERVVWSPFMFGTYLKEKFDPEEIRTVLPPEECPVCRGIGEGSLVVLKDDGANLLLRHINPRLDVQKQPIAVHLSIVSRRHVPQSSLTDDDNISRGELFQEAIKMYGITGGGWFEHLSGGPNSHASMEIVVPRPFDRGGVATVFTAGSVRPAQPSVE